MKGIDMFKKAMYLSGHDFPNPNHGDAINEISYINQIYSDLHYATKETEFVPLKTLSEEINLSERAVNDVMPYGVAMLISESENDGAKQQLFAIKYNQKRLSLTGSGNVKDVLPAPV